MERNEEEEVIVMDGLCGDIEVNGTPPVWGLEPSEADIPNLLLLSGSESMELIIGGTLAGFVILPGLLGDIPFGLRDFKLG